jgi:hypothetical protein
MGTSPKVERLKRWIEMDRLLFAGDLPLAEFLEKWGICRRQFDRDKADLRLLFKALDQTVRIEPFSPSMPTRRLYVRYRYVGVSRPLFTVNLPPEERERRGPNEEPKPSRRAPSEFFSRTTKQKKEPGGVAAFVRRAGKGRGEEGG